MNERIWRPLRFLVTNPEPDIQALSIAFQSEGKLYVLTITGPPHMETKDIYSLLRAATATVAQQAGDDMASLVPGVALLPEEEITCPGKPS